LKPYKCKDPECQDICFSSNACLFRHEREAHGLHGHGDNPHLCLWPNCERAQYGNGFPRRWNLGDHMKRVHGLDLAKGTPVSGFAADDRHGNSLPRKPKTSGSVQMKRTSSSKTKVQAASGSYSRDSRHATGGSRHHPQTSGSYQASSRMQGCNVLDPYDMTMENGQLAGYPLQSRHSQPYHANNFCQLVY